MTHFLTAAGQLIIKATANNTQPTPGYLLAEIEKRSYIGMEECELLEKCLRWQIRHQSWKIKYKALLIIKRVATRGNSDFKVLMKLDLSELKKCQTYQCRPDPVLGEEPCRRVRNAAKEALGALHAEGTQHRPAAKAKMTGFGSSAAPKNPIVRTNSFIAALEKGAKAVGGAVIKGAKFVGEHAKRAGEDISGKNLGSDRSNPNAPQSNTPGWNMASNRGAGAAAKPEYGAPQPNLGTATGSWGGSAGRAPAPAPAAPAAGNNNKAASDGRYERSLVKELLSQGGMRPVPPPQSVSRFVMKCRSLNATTMATILNEQLSKNSWQHRNKTLVTIEALLQDSQCRNIALVFKKSHISIEAQSRHPKPSIRKKAARVMQLISRVSPPAPKPEPEPEPEPEESGGFDFVGGGDDDGDVDDMFGGMEMEGGGGGGGGDGFGFIGGDDDAGAGGGDGGGDMFGDMSLVAPPEPGPSASTGFDFLGGGGDSAPAPAPAPASDGLLDLYGSAPAAPAPAPAATDDLFGGMMASAPAPAPAPSSYGGGGDVFGGFDAPAAPAPAPAAGGGGGGDLLGGLDFASSAPAAPAAPMGGMGGGTMASPKTSIYSAFDQLSMESGPTAQMPGTSSFSKYNAAPAPAPAAPAPAPAPAGGMGLGGGGAFDFIQDAMKS